MYVITAQQTEPRHEKTPPAEASGASTRRTKSSGVVVPVVPNPRHGKLLALLDVTRGKLVNPAKKKNAPEYPTAAAGVGVLFRISFVV